MTLTADEQLALPAKTVRPELMDITRVGDLQARPEYKVPWVLKNYSVVGALTLLAGREGEGKSLLALEMASVVASGGKFGLSKTAMPGRVLYVDAENGIAEMGRRCNLLKVDAAVGIAEADGFDMGSRWSDFSHFIRESAPRFVVLDSFASLWPQVEENDKKSVQQALQPLRSLALQSGTSFLLLHHMTKEGGYRGSGAIGAVVQIVIEMYPGSDESVRKLRWKKNRYGQRGAVQHLGITAHNDSLSIHPR